MALYSIISGQYNTSCVIFISRLNKFQLKYFVKAIKKALVSTADHEEKLERDDKNIKIYALLSYYYQKIYTYDLFAQILNPSLTVFLIFIVVPDFNVLRLVHSHIGARNLEVMTTQSYSCMPSLKEVFNTVTINYFK